MSEQGPDLGRMIQEEVDKNPKSTEGEKPLEMASAEGPVVEQEGPDVEKGDLDQDVETAFENITVDKETEEAAKQAELGGDTARKVQMAFEKGDTKGLGDVIKDFTEKGGDVSVLKEQLKGYHDAYKEAGLDAKAAEIDAFSRSLEAKTDVSTEGGKALLAKLESGGFSSIEDAINALDDLKEQAKGMDQAALDDLNNEFNALYAKINEKFMGEHEKNGPQSGVEMSDEDVDDLLSGLG